MNALQPNAIGFNLSNAYALVQFAGAAYRDAHELQTQATAWGFPQFRFLDSGTTQGYVMSNDHAIVIAFRGTEGKNLKDWMTNLNFDQVSLPEGDVHEGFNAAVDRVWEDLFTTVVKFRTRNQPLFLTGHSLGGALATLTALRLVNARQAVQGLYTFGAPRVGDRTYLDYFNMAMTDRAFRIVNDEDIVAKLPWKAIGYCHVGKKCRLDTDGNLTLEPLPFHGILAAIQDEVEDFLEPDWEFIRDHNLGAYEDAILKNLQRSSIQVSEKPPSEKPELGQREMVAAK